MSRASYFIDAPIIRDVGSSDVAGHGQESIVTFERVYSEIVTTEVLYFIMLGKIVPRPPLIGEVYHLWCIIFCTPCSLFSRPTRLRRATKINIIRHYHYFVISLNHCSEGETQNNSFHCVGLQYLSFRSKELIDSNHRCYDGTQPGASLGEQT